MNKKETYYFTFGQQHIHPTKGIPMKDYFIKVHGSYAEAREKMVQKYGDKWSIQYSEESLNKSFFPKGCFETL